MAIQPSLSGLAGSRVGEGCGGSEGEVAEGGNAAHLELFAADCGVDVEHQDDLFIDLLGVFLSPFGRADQAVFFGVPACVDDRAPGLPAVFHGCTQRVAHLERGCGSAAGIDRAVDPGVAMVADHDPAIGLDCAGEGRDDVPDLSDVVFHRDGHRDLGGSRADVIGQRQTSLPAGGDVGTGENFQNLVGRFVAERERGNCREILVAFEAGLLFPFGNGWATGSWAPAAKAPAGGV